MQIRRKICPFFGLRTDINIICDAHSMDNLLNYRLTIGVHILHCAFSAYILLSSLWKKEILKMIPVGVGRGLMSSMKRMANQEITDKRQKKIKEKKEAGQKSLIARFLLGIRF